MSNRHESSGSRITFGTILIIIGALYFLQTLSFFNFSIPHIIFSFPFVIFLIGLMVLINSRNKLFGGILTIIGILSLMPKIFPNFYFNDNILLPVVFIALGILIIFRRRPAYHHYNWQTGKTIDKDYIDEVAIFGGSHKIITTDNFKGGNITCIFGGSEIDFTQCKLAEGDVVVDMVMLFGGTNFIVPRDWNVRINVTPIFGGFANKAMRNPGVPLDTTRTLILKGVAIFGGGEIKSY